MTLIELSPHVFSFVLVLVSFLTGFGFCAAVMFMLWKEQPAGDFLRLDPGQTITVRGGADD